MIGKGRGKGWGSLRGRLKLSIDQGWGPGQELRLPVLRVRSAGVHSNIFVILRSIHKAKGCAHQPIKDMPSPGAVLSPQSFIHYPLHPTPDPQPRHSNQRHNQVTSRSQPGHIQVTSRSHPGHVNNTKNDKRHHKKPFNIFNIIIGNLYLRAHLLLFT